MLRWIRGTLFIRLWAAWTARLRGGSRKRALAPPRPSALSLGLSLILPIYYRGINLGYFISCRTQQLIVPVGPPVFEDYADLVAVFAFLV